MDLKERLSAMQMHERISFAKELQEKVARWAKTLDKDLPDAVKTARIKAMEREMEVDVVMESIRSHAEYLRGYRMETADPMRALATKAMGAAQNLTAGEVAIFTAMSAMPLETVQHLLPSLKGNAAGLLLIRADLAKRQDAGVSAELLKPLFTAWSEATGGMVDQEKVRTAAKAELQGLQYLHGNGTSLTATDRLNLGRRMAELEKVIVGDVKPPMPKLDLEPKERMNAGRQELEQAREAALAGSEDA